MEPITTTVAISTIVGYLAKKLKDNKSIQGFFDDFTEATVNWLKPIFIREDGSPKDSLKDLQENPDSKAQQNVVKGNLEVALEKNPQAASFLQDMLRHTLLPDHPDLISLQNILADIKQKLQNRL